MTRIFTAVSLIFAFSLASYAQERPDVAASLKGLKVKKHIRVHKEANQIRFTLDDDVDDKSGEKLETGQVFVTDRALKVSVQSYNPLKTLVTVKVKGVENASAATLAKLLEAIVAVGGIIKPSTSGASTAASMFTAASVLTKDASCAARIQLALRSGTVLNDTMFGELVSAAKIKTEYQTWSEAISDAYAGPSGPAALTAGAKGIATYASSLKKQIDLATTEIATVDKGAAETPTNECGRSVVSVYEFIRLTNPRARLAQLNELHKALTALEKKLRDMSSSADWVGRDYVIAKDIVVTQDLDADVTISIADLSVDAGDASVSVKQGDPASATAIIQMDTGWVLEPSVGLAVGYVTRPKYGTDTVDGKTVVGKVTNDRVSLNPSVMVNFIAREGTALLRPMVQVGASTSKDAPALFMGAGWRLFGTKKSGLAVGGGLMLAWVKDLKTLKENDPIAGTKDIENDLDFDWSRPKPRLYWSLQYKF